MAQNTLQGNTDGFFMAPLSPQFLARVGGLPWELKTMILVYMAAQDVKQLEAIRRSARFANATILLYQCDVVRYAFGTDSSPYSTAGRLYYSLYRPVSPGLCYLSRIARRCTIAKQLAIALAAQLEETPESNPSVHEVPGIRFDEASHARFIKNLSPYILALAYFFEKYRDGLAHYVPNPSFPGLGPSDNVEASILSSKYNDETVYRICALYLILNRILDRKLDPWCLQGVYRQLGSNQLPDTRGTQYCDGIQILTFGGIEAVKDVLAEPSRFPCRRVARHHLIKALPGLLTAGPASINAARRLPSSTLPRVDRAAGIRVLHQLPRSRSQILNVDHLDLFGYMKEPCSTEEELGRFYKHLLTYEANDPKLML